VVERPVIIKKRRHVKRHVVFEERPLKYGKRFYGKRYYGKHYDDDDDGRYGKRHFRKRHYGKQFDDDEEEAHY
jgi:hypothetical protein